MDSIESFLHRFPGYKLPHVAYFGAFFLSLILVWIYSWNFTGGPPFTLTENVWFGILFFLPYVAVYVFYYRYKHKRIALLVQNQTLVYAQFDKVVKSTDFNDPEFDYGDYHLLLRWTDSAGKTHEFVSDEVHDQIGDFFGAVNKEIEGKVKMYVHDHPQGIPVMIDSQNYANYKVDTSWLSVTGLSNKQKSADATFFTTIIFGVVAILVLFAVFGRSIYQYLQGLF